MDTHTVTRLLVVVATALSCIYCHSRTVRDDWRELDRYLTDAHILQVILDIQHLFTNNSRPRVVDRLVSITIQRELCNVTVLRRRGITGERRAIRLVDQPQCYPQDLESDQHKNATIRSKRSDPRFEEAIDFLDREMTIQTNSSKYLRITNFSKRARKIDYYVLYNAEFAKSNCTLEYMDLTYDYWGVCFVPWKKAQTVVVCSFVEIYFSAEDVFRLGKQNCSTNGFFR